MCVILGGSDGSGWFARGCPGWDEVVVVLVNSVIRDGPFYGAWCFDFLGT